MKKIWIIIIIVALAVPGAIMLSRKDGSSPERLDNNPVSIGDFRRVGIVVFNNPGLKPGVPHLIYEEPGKPALKAELIFNEETICEAPGGQEPCLALNVSAETFFGGKRFLVEGKERGGEVLVNRMTVLP